MNVDPNGSFFEVIIGAALFAMGKVFVEKTKQDIEEIKAIETSSDRVVVSEGNVHIKDSHNVKTPWGKYAYAFYLNHIKKETKDVIKGSTLGAYIEWEAHNVACLFGAGEAAKSVDIGATIFHDGFSHNMFDNSIEGLLSAGMRFAYKRVFRYIALFDYIVFLKDVL
ncbi:MAG: hypothetical protein IJZ73_06625 [Clostridia bacterium]|nr:hypothetical protein [Clostridia bacterium]